MRDRVAWAGGGSLNCGSDWDEDLDMFSRPCNPGGGMTGSCFQAYTGVVYREQADERRLMWSLYPGCAGLLAKYMSKPCERKTNATSELSDTC